MVHKTILLLSVLIFGCNDFFQNEQNSQERVWVFVESAEQQCITPDYSSLEEAVNELETNNIAVLDSVEQNYLVCEACSCPSGINYHALIKENKLDEAFELGWQRVDEGDDTPE